MAPPETTPKPNLVQTTILPTSATVPTMPTTTTKNHTDDEETTMAKAALIVDSMAFPMTMLASIQLGLLEIIANKEKENGPVTASEVAAELKTENPLAPDMVARMLRLLASFSVISCSVEIGKGKVFGMTPVGKCFVKDEDGVSLGPLMMLLQDKVFMEGWYKLKDAVLEGGVPFDMAHGMNAFEYPGTDPRFNQVFNMAMFNHTTIMMRKVLESYKGFENINQLVDVGGGLGHNLKIIMSKYPTIKGINFDLPHVTQHGISHPGMEHVGGDMFKTVPCADAIFMKWILHDWGDDYCLNLLKNCHKALPPNGKVIVVESIVAEEPETTIEAQAMCEMDLIMMTQNPGGKERTKKEFLALAEATGFAGIRFEAQVCGLWIMEFYK